VREVSNKNNYGAESNAIIWHFISKAWPMQKQCLSTIFNKFYS